jgi:formylmethanofuran dehydrogenase subunit A
MSGALLKVSGGVVYDPANGVDGEVRDLWVEGGRSSRRRRRSVGERFGTSQ